jgi:hypothetical protein
VDTCGVADDHMHTRIGCSVLGLMIIVAATAHAQALPDSPVILRSGSWDVHRTHDAMSDASVCTGIYNGRFDIQLSDNALTIGVTDRIKSVRLRFDDAAAQAPRAATRSELHDSRIEIVGNDFAEALNSHRLRYEAVTFGDVVVAGDLDLNGIYVARGNIRAGCAGNPIVMSMPPAPAADKCTPELRQRMTDNGIPAANIEQICRD